MKPRDFLDVADALMGGTQEAEWRSAVSRALLRQGGFQVPDGDQAHAYLWRRLSNCGHPDVEIAGRDLSILRTERNRADYDLDRPLDQGPAFNRVLLATSILDLLEAVAAEPAIRDPIIEAIKVYERDVLRQVTWQP
jgi:hypothetical protein